MSFGEFIKNAALARLRKLSSPSATGIVPGSPRTFILQEGDALTVTGAAATTGTVQRLDAAGSWTIGVGKLPQIGAFLGTSSFTVTCTAGSVDVSVGAAVLGAVIKGRAANTVLGGGFNAWTYTQYLGVGSNRTLTNVLSAWGSFSGVKLVFANSETSAATIDKVSVGVGPTIYPSGVPNLRAASNVYSAPIGPINIAANASGTKKQPVLYTTVELPAISVPRAGAEADGGIMPLLFVNVYSATGNATVPVADLTAAWATNYSATNEGFTLQTGLVNATDAVTTPANWTAATPADFASMVVFGAIFNYDTPMPSVLCVGDSYRMGLGDGKSGIQPYVWKAAARLRKVKKLSFFNGAKSGATMADFEQNTIALIDLMAPSVIIIPCATTNSAFQSQADFDVQWSSFKRQVAYARSKGILVVGETPLANSGYNSARNVFRLKQRKRLFDLAAVSDGGIIAADYDQFINSSGGWLDPTITVDGAGVGELKPAGHDLLAPVMYAALNSVIPDSAP